MSDVLGAFSEEHAAELTGVSLKQLRHWERIGLLVPSFSDDRHVPYGRIYSFRDLVSLRVLEQLRNKAGCSIAHLLDVAKELRAISDDPWASTTLYVANKRVVVALPGTKVRVEVVGGQTILDIPIRTVITGLRSRVAEMNERKPEQLGQVIEAKFVAQGQPVFKGTRIPVADVLSFADAGYDAAAIIKQYPGLAVADVEAAIARQGRTAA
jgi:DNA-binding transcriptional MerR regulator